MTEIGVRLLSPVEDMAEVTVMAGTWAVGAEVRLDAGRPHTVWIPYRVPGGDAATLLVDFAAGDLRSRAERHISPRIIGAAAGPIAIATDDTALYSAIGRSASGIAAFGAPAENLPRLAQAYDVVDAVVIDASTLAKLDTSQLRALETYLAGCGRLLVVNLPRSAVASLRQLAGCGGAFVLGAGGADRAPAALRDLISSAPPDLPGPRQLAGVAELGSVSVTGTTVAACAALYLVLAATAGAFARSAWPMLAIPIAALGLLTLTWQGPANETRMVLWADGDAEAGPVRYAALLSVNGRTRSMAHVGLPATAQILSAPPLPAGAVLRLTPGGNGGWVESISFPSYLMAEDRVYIRGTGEVSPPARLGLAEGRPVVANERAGALVGAFLNWRGRHYAVPPLQRGETWSPTQDAGLSDGDTPLPAKLAALGRGPAPALILPLSEQDLTQITGGSGGAGWLRLPVSRNAGQDRQNRPS